MDKLEFESMTLCPLDGRYGKIKDPELADCFSEYALVKYKSVCRNPVVEVPVGSPSYRNFRQG